MKPLSIFTPSKEDTRLPPTRVMRVLVPIAHSLASFCLGLLFSLIVGVFAYFGGLIIEMATEAPKGFVYQRTGTRHIGVGGLVIFPAIGLLVVMRQKLAEFMEHTVALTIGMISGVVLVLGWLVASISGIPAR